MVKMQSPHSIIKSKSSPLTSCSTLDSSLPSYLRCIDELLTVQSTTTRPSTRKVPFSLSEKAAAHKKATHTASLKNKQNNHPFTSYIFIKQTLYARLCSKHGCPTQHRTACYSSDCEPSTVQYEALLHMNLWLPASVGYGCDSDGKSWVCFPGPHFTQSTIFKNTEQGTCRGLTHKAKLCKFQQLCC